MQRHIGEFFIGAGSKVQKICKRISGVCVITNFKKATTSAYVFLFYALLIPLVNYQHMGFVEEGSVEWFETEISSLRFLQVLSNLLWKLAIYFAKWKLFFRWNISMNKGLFTWRWGTPGGWDNLLRWGNPPVHIISHFNFITFTW